MNSPRDIVLTGIPRAGTTLTCSLINEAQNAVALFEPMQVELLKPGRTGAEQVQAFFSETRGSILREGIAYSQHVDGRVPDNPFGSTWLEDGRREHKAVRGLIEIRKAVSPDFTLAIKHNGAYTALLPELRDTFDCYGFIRNPVSVLGSWSSVDLPVAHGRIPAAERLDAELKAALDAEPDTLVRQLRIIDWFFGRFSQYLGKERVLRYESLVSSDGQALAEMTGIPLPARALDSRNSSRLYRGEQAARWADALLRLGGAWSDWYPESEIVGAAEQLGRAQ